uniref:Uncharacterized protein n=1 Tax=Mola mola TaxID=94237 RepID=A0A3Q3VU30_MOLML
MQKTFVCDETMRITIPIGSLRDVRGSQLVSNQFQCVYKDSYKVFVINGKPKPLGVSPVVSLNRQICNNSEFFFVVSGMLSYAAGQSPNMHVTKLSFSLNIISFLWSIMAVSIYALAFSHPLLQLSEGIQGLIMSLLVVETFITLFLIYWLSKAICRQHFNTLPIILLKYGD